MATVGFIKELGFDYTLPTHNKIK